MWNRVGIVRQVTQKQCRIKRIDAPLKTALDIHKTIFKDSGSV